MVRQARRSGGDCAGLDQLQTTLVENAQRFLQRAKASEYVMCRYQGMLDGIDREIEVQRAECRGKKTP
jgi:hypothetical protein